MCNICVFAGTTEGRELAEFLAGQPVQATVCVATEYGETLLPEAKNVTVLAGRIPVTDIIRMLQETRFDLVIDATDNFAAKFLINDRCHPPLRRLHHREHLHGLPGDGNRISAPAAAVL